jgi:hypothetical protein
VQPLWKAFWRTPENVEIELLCNPMIPLPCIYPKECAPRYDRTTCIPMFIAVLFIIVKLWKHSGYPTADEWNKKII